MARTIDVIQQEIIDNLSAKGIVVNGSMASIRRIWTRVIAYAHFVMESLFDTHVAEVEEMITNLKPGTLNWYRHMSLNFQLGGTLLPNSDTYDNSLLTDAQIAAQKIVANAAVVKEDGVIKVKVTRLVSNDYAPLDNTQISAFTAYLENEFQYAGDEVVIVNASADTVTMELDIWYNPEIMKANGDLVDGTPDPVKAAAIAYFKNVSFNGRYFKSDNLTFLKSVKGITDVKIVNIIATDVNANVTIIDTQYQPFSGFMRVMSNDDIVINSRNVQK